MILCLSLEGLRTIEPALEKKLGLEPFTIEETREATPLPEVASGITCKSGRGPTATAKVIDQERK